MGTATAVSPATIFTETSAVSLPARRIVVADELGYCWGVRRALDIITDAADPADKIAPVGDVIHNPQVVERLRERGVEGTASVDEAVSRGFRRVAITAHGMGPHLAREAEAANLTLIDTTCPLVTKVQRLAQKLVRQGYFIVVYGDGYHPEVKSVIAWAGTSKALAAKKMIDLPWNARRGEKGEGKVPPPRKVAVVSQTTKNVDELMAFANQLQALVIPEGGEFRLCNTICEPTSERQHALKRLVERDSVDLILAIGGKKSSNTARLADVGRQMGVESHHIERPEDIEDGWLSAASVIGVTAGASTPDDVIEDVVNVLVAKGYAAPEGGIRPVDPEYVPAF
ncbi:MAG: 4-hydroxy-3-methylbut-2-enyl diphosphate reductase [Chloroflexota bacterium]|nr:4-hydroxy-3-methylbut-2-enyl diphosphate reductase [Chloroflexia bacterium]MDQ3167984.1 4-hydroxy-3-methylbut-2-enyl diphosphate reductase [Chloroflexota bacterium]